MRPQVVAKVDQSADGGPTDVDGRPAGNQGAWESTGIVDASAAFGPGAFLINVQAHTLWVEKAPGDDNNGDGQPDFTYKREGGQLAADPHPGHLAGSPANKWGRLSGRPLRYLSARPVGAGRGSGAGRGERGRGVPGRA